MFKIVYICALFLICSPTSLSKRQLPSFLQICKRDHPDLHKCITSSIDNLKPHLADGVPEMRLPPFNPFNFIEIGYDTGTVKFTFRNAKFGLAHQFDVSDLDMDLEACKLSMKIYYPLLDISGDYRLVGKLFILDLDGEGTFTGNLTGAAGTIQFFCNRELENNIEYMKFKDFDLKVQIEDVKFQLNNLFKNNQQLTDITNAAINDNSKSLAADFSTHLAKSLGETSLHVVQTVFDRFSMDELLPK